MILEPFNGSPPQLSKHMMLKALPVPPIPALTNAFHAEFQIIDFLPVCARLKWGKCFRPLIFYSRWNLFVKTQSSLWGHWEGVEEGEGWGFWEGFGAPTSSSSRAAALLPHWTSIEGFVLLTGKKKKEQKSSYPVPWFIGEEITQEKRYQIGMTTELFNLVVATKSPEEPVTQS